MESGRSGRKSEIEMLRKELNLLNRSMEEVDGSIEKEDSVRIYAGEMREVASLIESVVDEYDLMTVKQRSYLKKAIVLVGKLTGRDDQRRDIKNIKALLAEVRVKGEASSIRKLRRDAVVDQRRQFVSAPDTVVDQHRQFVSAPYTELVGFDTETKDMINVFLLGGESRRSTVSIVGMGGSGKTTLAARMFNNDAVKKHFDIRHWIAAPYDGFEMEQIQRSMAMQVLQQRWEEGVSVEAVRESLKGKRYLIVFDDVWEEDPYGVICDLLPDDGVGSRVIVTTRSHPVAQNFIKGPSNHIHWMEGLTKEMSFELFCRTAFRFELEGRCPVELQEVSSKIVNLCRGSPLLIRVVAGLLSTKPKVLEDWLRLLENLSADTQNELYLKGVSLAFDDLPPELKKCFMYFSVFAYKPLIQNEKLIRLWITEDFIQETRGKALEEVAEEYLEELLGRNLVEASNEFYGINKFCCAHDLIRDLVRMKATNRDFCMVDDGMSSISSLEKKYRRITIASSDSLQNRLNTVKVKESWVRSVFLRNAGPLDSSLLLRLFKKFYLLTMFDIENCHLEILPKEVGNLSCLKYLSLKNTGVKKLPKTIGALNRLEVLDLSGTLLVELCTEIAKLGSLRHLLASHGDVDEIGLDSSKGVKIKEGIGAVGNLQTLTMVDAKLSGMNVIQELKKLNQLRSLKVTRLTSELVGALSACISEMAHLKSLHLESMKNEILDLQNVTSPPIHLEYFVLKGELSSIPDWIFRLGNLQIMCLSLSSLVDDPLPSLRLLPNLEYLWLYGAYQGPQLVFQDGFGKLKLLVLREMWGLESIEISDSTMPLLEELRIGPSPLLKEVPAGIAQLSCLRVLSFYDMPDEFVLSLQPEGGSGFPRIQHVSSVLFCYRNTARRGYISYKLGEPYLLRSLNDVDTGGGQQQDPRLSFSFSDDEGDTSAASSHWDNIRQLSFRSDMHSLFSDDFED